MPLTITGHDGQAVIPDTHTAPDRPRARGRVERAWSPVLTGTLGVFISLVPVGALLWHRRVPKAWDFFRYLVLSEFFSDAISAGVWSPRFIPDMNGGYGYPLFVFYQPGYFYLSHLFSFVDAAVLRCGLTLGVVALVGGLGAYRLIRCFAPPRASLFFLLMFQLTPYHFTEIYGRGDLSEWIALQLSPWPLYFTYRLAQASAEGPAERRAPAWRGLGLALALAAMCYAHPVACVFFLPAFGALVCALGLSLAPRERRPFLERALAGTLIGVALSAPYWLTVLTMKRYVNSQAALGGHFDPSMHLLSPLAFFWSEGAALSRQLGLSFELGPVHFGLALAGVWCGRRDRFILAAGAMYAALLVLMTPAAVWFWSLYPFYLMQFPWRLLAVVAIFQLMCMLGLSRLEWAWPRTGVAVAVALVTITLLWQWDALVFRPMPDGILESPQARLMLSASFPEGAAFVPMNVTRPGGGDIRNTVANVRRAVPLSRISTFDNAEWVPITALAHPPSRPRGESLVELVTGSASLVPAEGSSKFRLDYVIDAATASAIRINQLYLPGWRVVLDGRAVSEASLRHDVAADGRIAVSMGPGRHRLLAWYDGPPGWRWTTALMLALVAVCLLWLFRTSRPRP